jgi:hypothetical protein
MGDSFGVPHLGASLYDSIRRPKAALNRIAMVIAKMATARGIHLLRIAPRFSL